METESLFQHLQVPATCFYPDSNQSNPCLPSNFLKIHLNIIIPSTPGSFKWSLSLRFPHQNPALTSSLPHTCYMYMPVPISFFSNWSPEQHWVTRRDHEAPHYVVFSTPLSPRPLRAKYSLHPILKHPQPTFLTQCERQSFTPIQNNKQNYSSVYFNLSIFG